MKKGQIFSLDLMIAILVILVIMGSMAILLYQYQIFEDQQTQLRNLEMRSESALNVLLLTKGNPENWNESQDPCNEVKTLGFLSEPAIISEQKLRNFTTMDYDCTKLLLGISGYDFYFEVRNETGDIINVDGTDIQTGIVPTAGSEAIFSTRKATLSNNNLIDITLGVWYE